MPKVTFLPAGKMVKARVGQSLVSIAGAHRILIPQRCGGHASCLMCKVVIEQGEVSPPSELERRKMQEKDLDSQIRLGCQARLTEKDCVVRIPDNRLKSVVQAALERQRAEEEEEW